MIEVEVKAWASPSTLEHRLASLGYSPTKVVSKWDRYFSSEDNQRTIRLRKFINQEQGAGGEELAMTAKQKTVVDGIETSDEIEIIVSSEQDALRLISYLGFKQTGLKSKSSVVYRWSPTTMIEINSVGTLQPLVEIETLLPIGSDVARLTNAAAELLDILDTLGVPRAQIETRSYLELLRTSNPAGASVIER